MSAKQLTIAQQRFVEAYASSYNVAEALKEAGYKPYHSTENILMLTTRTALT